MICAGTDSGRLLIWKFKDDETFELLIDKQSMSNSIENIVYTLPRNFIGVSGTTSDANESTIKIYEKPSYSNIIFRLEFRAFESNNQQTRLGVANFFEDSSLLVWQNSRLKHYCLDRYRSSGNSVVEYPVETIRDVAILRDTYRNEPRGHVLLAFSDRIEMWDTRYRFHRNRSSIAVGDVGLPVQRLGSLLATDGGAILNYNNNNIFDIKVTKRSEFENIKVMAHRVIGSYLLITSYVDTTNLRFFEDQENLLACTTKNHTTRTDISEPFVIHNNDIFARDRSNPNSIKKLCPVDEWRPQEGMEDVTTFSPFDNGYTLRHFQIKNAELYAIGQKGDEWLIKKYPMYIRGQSYELIDLNNYESYCGESYTFTIPQADTTFRALILTDEDDSSNLFLSSGHCLYFSSLASPHEWHVLAHMGAVVSFAADHGRDLYTTDNTGTLYIWNQQEQGVPSLNYREKLVPTRRVLNLQDYNSYYRKPFAVSDSASGQIYYTLNGYGGYYSGTPRIKWKSTGEQYSPDIDNIVYFPLYSPFILMPDIVPSAIFGKQFSFEKNKKNRQSPSAVWIIPQGVPEYESFTISAWIMLSEYKSEDKYDSYKATIVASRTRGSETGWSLSAAGYVCYKFDDTVYSDDRLPLNAWVNIAVTYDKSTKTMTFYANGIQQNVSKDVDFSLSNGLPDRNLIIGGYPNYTNRSFEGSLGTFTISNSATPEAYLKSTYKDYYHWKAFDETRRGAIPAKISFPCRGYHYAVTSNEEDVSIAPPGIFLDEDATDLTLFVWVRPSTRLDASRRTVFMSAGDPADNPDWMLSADAETIYFGYRGKNWQELKVEYDLSRNMATHIAIVFTKETITMYINGLAYPGNSKSADDFNMRSKRRELRLASIVENGEYAYFEGWLSKLMVYTTAATAEQIQTCVEHTFTSSPDLEIRRSAQVEGKQQLRGIVLSPTFYSAIRLDRDYSAIELAHPAELLEKIYEE